MRIRLKIDGVDQTTYLRANSWQIETNIGAKLDSFKFILDDRSNAITPARGKEVLVENWDDANTRFFGGVLTEVTDYTAGLGRMFDCGALDWTLILDRAIVSQQYRGKSDLYIITEAAASPKGIFTGSDTDLSDFDYTTNVVVGQPNTQFLQLKNDTIRDVMDQLVDMVPASYVWGVDAFKAVYYRPATAVGHSFGMSDSPDATDSLLAHYRGLKRIRDVTKVVNSVIVEGGFIRELLADIPASGGSSNVFVGDGVETKYSTKSLYVASSGNARIRVYRNDGADAAPPWGTQVELTVGLSTQDTLVTHQVLWDPVGRSLEFATAPPNKVNSFRVDGDRLRGLIFNAEDSASITAFGRRYGYSIKDPTLLSDKQVELKAQGELKKRKAEAERLTFATTKDGITTGRSLRIKNTILGIDADYLVEKVVMKLQGGTIMDYQVTCQGIPAA